MPKLFYLLFFLFLIIWFVLLGYFLLNLLPSQKFLFKNTSASGGTANGGLSRLAGDKPTMAAAVPIKATWYGEGDKECLGCRKDRLTASGEPYDENKMTAACNFLPLNSKVKISYQGKEIMVLITDRMLDDNKIDLSKNAFERLENLDKGIISVTISELKF